MPISNYVPTSAIARPGVCTSSTRPASPYEGQVIYETDTDRTLVWNGSGWVFLSTSTANPVGLEFITQTSATSGASLPVDNCFSSAYDNYRILIDNFQPSLINQSLNLRMRVNGVDASSIDYYWGLSGIYTDGTNAASSGSDQTSLATGLYNSANTLALGNATMDVFSPNRAERTYFNINSVLYAGKFGARTGFAEHNLTIPYTGFSLLPGSGNISNVRVWVYGYRK